MSLDDPFWGPEPEVTEAEQDAIDGKLPDGWGVFPDDDPITLQVNGEPVPWAAAKMIPGRKGRFFPARQVKAADLIKSEFGKLGVGKVPKGYGVVVGLTFTVTRPQSHYGSGRNAHVLKPSAPDYPTGRPDLSNLIKLVEDALTGVAWVDDDQVVMLRNPRKFYAKTEATVIQLWMAPGAKLDRDLNRVQEPEPDPDADQLSLT